MKGICFIYLFIIFVFYFLNYNNYMTMNYTRGKEKMKKLIIYIVTCHVSESGESDGL